MLENTGYCKQKRNPKSIEPEVSNFIPLYLSTETTAATPSVFESCDPILLNEVYETKGGSIINIFIIYKVESLHQTTYYFYLNKAFHNYSHIFWCMSGQVTYRDFQVELRAIINM